MSHPIAPGLVVPDTPETRTYSAALYQLADELDKEEGCTTEDPELIRQAAQRLDEQTVCINYLKQQRELLLAGLKRVIDEQCAPRSRRLAIDAITLAEGKPAAAALLPEERECCGTFPRTPHRATCKHYRGKKGKSA